MYPMPSLTHMLDILGNSSRGVTLSFYAININVVSLFTD